MVRSVGLSVTEGGEGKADPRLGQGVEVGEEAGETGDKKGRPRYLVEEEMRRDEVVKLKEEERGEGEALKW